MLLSELLVAETLVRQEDIERALESRNESGELLGQCLVTQGALTEAQLDEVIDRRPIWPKTVEETGLGMNFLVTLMLKAMHSIGLESSRAIADELKLPALIVESLLEHSRERQLTEALGASAQAGIATEIRYALSAKGREHAAAALTRSAYIGPAPVSLSDYRNQIKKQGIGKDHVDDTALSACLSHLIIPDGLLDRLGPAVNSGQCMLLHGPPGNGKSSIAVAIGRSFRQLIYVPYCVEVGGEIVKVFDPTIHQEQESAFAKKRGEGGIVTIPKSTMDLRWVCCRRPILTTGIDLTLDRLELAHLPQANYYDAPIQMKACGGVVLIDDFGRQRVRPVDILNRWVAPSERGSDHLTLENGNKFSIDFDALIIFATNLPIQEIIDAGVSWRIPYRIRVEPPSRDAYIQLLERECAAHDLPFSAEIDAMLSNGQIADDDRPLAWYHPRFIVDHVIASCKYRNLPPRLDRELVAGALDNLYAGG